ncbi:hypothetical protein RVR_2378 [Actinacidiphila reveromycinica]|uniref:Transposase n=1 Tax=Actinacidiphila reveromycinica TaxID=659352 RepID=A0A7U3UQL4_9ACTN|nr:hypothetical protein RVR_2378 [Streptomyces sp. SN-593]
MTVSDMCAARCAGWGASPWIVSDELWELLCGTLFVLHTGIQWERLPQELPRSSTGAIQARNTT